MMLFGGMVDGVVRPVFEPLFKAPRELLSLGAPQASQLSQGALPGGPGSCFGCWGAEGLRCGVLAAQHSCAVLGLTAAGTSRP